MAYTCFASYYDSLTDDVSYRSRAVYFDSLIKKYAADAKLILDFACGTGSLCAELLPLGYDVIGVDGSAEMLSIAVQKAPEALFLCQNMTELNLYGTVDATICALDSLNHLADINDLQAAISRVATFTAPSGIFIFDVNTVYKHGSVLANNIFFYENDICCCVWRNEYTEENHIVNIDLDFFVKENELYRRESESFCERAYTGAELDAVIASAGLEVLAVYAGDTMNPPQSDTERLVYVTRKLPPSRGGIAANNADETEHEKTEETTNEHTRSIHLRRRGNNLHSD